MGQTEAHCGQSSQPVTQAEASLECLCNAALSAGARVRPPGGRWGTDRGHNMYPIYNSPTLACRNLEGPYLFYLTVQ